MTPAENDVRFFEQQGYWLAGRVLDEAELEPLRRAHAEVFAGRHESGREPYSRDGESGQCPGGLRAIENAHRANSTLRRVVESPLLGEIAACLMRTTEVRLWSDRLIERPGRKACAERSGGGIGWRQNASSWQCTCFDLITARVALDDVAREQGGLQVVPGSHRWGLFDAEALCQADPGKLQDLVREKAGRECEVFPCELKAGEAVFYHCLTIRGSGPNGTERPCRSLEVHLQPNHAYYIPGTCDDDHMNVVLLRESEGHAGDLFRGDPWPVVYPKGR